MRIAAPKNWRIGAKITAAALLVLAARLASALPQLWPTGVKNYGELVLSAIAAALLILLVAGIVWLAYRLWARWNTITLRWGVAIAIGLAALTTAAWMRALAEAHMPEASARIIGAFLNVVMLVAAVLAYRWIVRFVIRSAQLVEPLDSLYQPSGRSQRVHLFAVLLGFAVWLTALEIARPFEGSSPHRDFLIGLLLPVGLGYLTFKLTMWSLLPRSRDALPVGGFEIQPTESERA